MNTSVNLNEFSKDQLQWILNKATMEMQDILAWKQMVKEYQLEDLMRDLWKQKTRLAKDLELITVQVLNAMGDIAVRENIASN